MKKQFLAILLLAGIGSKAQIGIGTTTPNSTLDLRGSLATKYTSFTGNTTAGASDNMLVFTGTAVTTLTLPDATTCQGRIYWIKNSSSNSSTLTVATTSSQTIDGLSTWPLAQANKVVRVVSNGTNWLIASESVPGNSGSPWIHGGNSVASMQTIGTTSNFDLPFITNNTEKMRLTASGNLGIGTSAFNGTYPEKLLVDAGTTTSVNAIVGKGSINNYLQLNIQNNNAGTNASSDVVATANNGSETTNYVDMGINSSANTSGAMGGANDAYLYNIGQNLLIGTGTASKSLVFMTGGTSQSTNERMRIDGSGNVGIGTASPAYKLHISGANPLFLAGVQTGAGTDSVLTIINGVVKKISPAALASSSSNAWSLTGNASTNPSTNFLGTTDAQALVIKENNTQVGRFDASSIALGNGATINNATNSYALGSGATVSFNKSNALSIGNSASVSANNSFVLGNSASATATNAFAIGNSANSNSANSFAIGPSAFNAYSITDGIAIGDNATTNASNSIAIGSNSTVANATTTNGASAIAIGNTAVASSANAIAIGTNSLTGYNLTNPLVIGNGTTANGNNAVVLGNSASIGFVDNATALGAATSVTNNNSTAIGYNTKVTKSDAIILGDMTNTSLSVGVGSESFNGSNREKLLVDAGTNASGAFQNVIVGKGNTNSYAQLNIQNYSTGTAASSDVVATANNGTESVNYIDMGINGGGNTSTGVLGGANTAYLYSTGNDFAIGNGTSGKNLNFFTNSGGIAERMRISSTGNVGINNTTPTEKLDVTGNIRFSGALMPNNTAGTAGSVLVSAGAGLAPTWQDPTSYISGSAWMQDGNTFSSAQSFGTISNHDIPVITNNTERMRISSTGSIGIGTSTFNAINPERLIVNAGTPALSTDFQNVIVGKGNTNSYAQLNIQNTNAGTAASSDVVATANNGNETANFIDMGVNGSGNASTGILGGANTAYLYSTAGDLVVGNATNNKDVAVFTTTGSTSTERMRVLSTGNVGINTSVPASTLDVAGSVSAAITLISANITLDGTHSTVIINSGTPSITLPAASACPRRIYTIVNQTAGARTISSYRNFTNLSTTTVGASSSITIQSDGTNWYQIR